MDTKELINAEADSINKMFVDHGIHAIISKKLTTEVKSSFISYGLRLGPGESLKNVEKIQRELSNELTSNRVRMMRGYTGRAVVRLRDYPLAIEVPHPTPTPLNWDVAPMRMGRYHALIGRSYSYTGARDEYIDLDRDYHMLVAAMSGGGKSTLMRMALLTLARNTSPDILKIILIDLKNDDLVPFRRLSHVIQYAGDIESAAEVINYVHDIKTERIRTQEKPYRLLLVIDELAELGPDKEALKKLGSILSTGRSLGINVWGGTQYPSAASIGSVVSASFTTRVVGRVDGKNSAYVATKRAGSGAEFLTLPGDFLRIDGSDLVRMKCYNISQDDTAALIKQIAGKSQVDIAPVMVSTPKKSETEEVAEKIATMYAGGASKNAMSKHAFGLPYGGRHAAKIDAAIAFLVENSSSSASSESSSGASSEASSTLSHTSQNNVTVLVEEERNKIINMATKRVARG